VTDSWTDSNGDNVPSDWTPGGPLTPADEWGSGCGCAPTDAPAIAKGIIITGRPATITAMPWQITLNDGAAPANFTIDHYDAAGGLIDNPLSFSGVDGSASFANPVYLADDPVEALEAATKQYVDARGGIPDAPSINWYFGRFNGAWAVIPIQSDAPTDGQAYVRQDAGWSLAVTGGPFLPLAGGTITGNLQVNGVMSVMGSNSLALSDSAGGQRAILGQTSGTVRWQMILGDQAAESLPANGSNFTLNACNNLGTVISTPLSIRRSDGAATFGGSLTVTGGATFNNGFAVNGLAAFDNVGNLYIPGGNPGDVLTTNGAAHLSWAPQTGGGIGEAPTDGQQYARQNAAWSPVTGGGGGGIPEAPTDGSAYARVNGDWYSGGDFAEGITISASSPLALNIPEYGGVNGIQMYVNPNWDRRWAITYNSGTDPNDGSNTGSNFNITAFKDDGSSIDAVTITRATGDVTINRDPTQALGIATKQYVDAHLPAASTTTPLPNGVAAVGTSAAYARADHVHPSDAYPHDNRIINGDMRIDQRNNFATITPAPAQYVADRWKFGATQTAKFSTLSQGAGAPGLANGFGRQLTLNTIAAYTPLTADYFQLYHTLEADMITDFAFGTPNAKPVTLSFWVFSTTLTGLFGGSLTNDGATRSYPFTFTVPTAGVWTRIVVTIPGDTAGAWVLQGNAAGAALHFDLGTGPTYRGAAGAWGAANYVGATGTVSPVATASQTTAFANVKLEVGSIATPFNRQTMAKLLADCQRYYQTGQVAHAGFNANAGASCYATAYFMTTMRAGPTFAMVSNNNSNFTLSSWAGLALGANGVTAVGTAGVAGPVTINMTFTANADY
jgi:hypothetical protein